MRHLSLLLIPIPLGVLPGKTLLISVNQIRNFYFHLVDRYFTTSEYEPPKPKAPPSPLPEAMPPFKKNIYNLELRIAIFFTICTYNSGEDIMKEIDEFFK